jgi:hypothetical protein
MVWRAHECLDPMRNTITLSILSSEMAVQLHVMLAACTFLLISAVFSAICWVVLRALKLQCAFSQGGHMGLVKQEYR